MSFTIPLPTYERREQVQALKIAAVVPNPRGYELHFEDQRFCPIQVSSSPGWSPPSVGTYFVIDGDETSIMSAAAFEAGYTLVPADTERGDA